MIIAIDIGGTKTLVATFGDKGDISHKERILTATDPEQFLRDLETILAQFAIKPTDRLAVAVPGIVNHAGTVVISPNLGWQHFKLKEILEDRYKCAVQVANDADLAGLGETNMLTPLPPLSLYVTVSTGIGTGIIVNGKLIQALSNSEGGHMVFQTKDGLKEWEDFASGRAIKSQFDRLAKDIEDPADWEIIANNIAVGLRALIAALQPQVVIIGGSIGTYFDRYKDALLAVLERQLPAMITLPTIQAARHPEEAVLYGCYHFAAQR